MLIYEPKGRAREYAGLACNLYSGCGHGCIYCYAPAVLRRTTDEFVAAKARPNCLADLARECKRKPGHGEQVLLCFTCDPYQPLDVQEQQTRQAIQMLHSAGYAIQVLTKGGRRALRDMDLFTAQDAFATTLTLLSDEHSRKWEPRAALPQERIETLQRFHEAGIPTWVSLEPVLNPVSALEIIRRTYEFVDMFKVGKLNNHPLASRIDWATFAQEAVQLLKETHSQFYIKLDLAAYLDESAKSDIRHYLHGPDNSTATRH